jgi:PAS domain S-box-containing protein
MIATIQNTKERQQHFLFTEPYLTFPAVIIVHEDVTGRSSLSQLDDNSVGVIKGFAISEYIINQNTRINLVEVDSVVEGLHKTSSGLLDAFVSDIAVTSHFLRKLGISSLKVSGELDYQWNLCMATAKDNVILHSILKKGLASIKTSRRERIIDRWIYFETIPFYQTRLFYRIITLFLLVLSSLLTLLILWNRRLVQTVNVQNRELKLNEIRLETLVNLGHMHTTHIQEITDYALEEAVRLTESSIGYIAFLNEDESVLTMNSWSKNAMRMCNVEIKKMMYKLEEMGLWGEAVRQRKPIITNDYGAPNPAKKGYPKGHIPLKRHMNAPIFDGDKIVVVAGVGNKTGNYNEGDVRQLTLLMDGMWKFIQKRKSEEKLKDLQDYLSNILDSMPSIIIAVDNECRITQWNHKAGEWFGFPAENIIGTDLTEKVPALRLYREKIIESINSHEIITEHDCTLPGEKKGIVMDLTIYPLENIGAEGAVLRIDDVTDAHYLMEQIIHTSKMDALGQLSGGVAHDFNNMLSAIMNGAELLRSIKTQDRTDKYIDMILDASGRAADLTQKLLAFSRKEVLKKTNLDLIKMIDDSILIISRTVNKKVKIIFNKNHGESGVIGDYTSLQNVLLNLAINSSHAMPEGGQISITTGTRLLDPIYCRTSQFDIEPGSYCEIVFNDNGTGIPNEIQERMFEPFFSTKNPGKGTGLGLATVYRTIVDHRGTIDVDSEPGHGTTFHILLPTAQLDSTDSQDDERVSPGTGNILVVDDEQMVLESVGEILKTMGYHVIMASTGQEAIDVYQNNPVFFDLVLLDMLMPEMDGRQVFFALKEVDRQCKVVLSSGYMKQEDLDFLKRSGLDGFIRKPYTKSELRKVLFNILGE